MTATPRPPEYYYSVSVSSEPVRGLPRLTEVSIFAKHGKYELLAKTDSIAKAALIVKAVNTHDRAKAVLEQVDTWFKQYCPADVARQAAASNLQVSIMALRTDMEG